MMQFLNGLGLGGPHGRGIGNGNTELIRFKAGKCSLTKGPADSRSFSVTADKTPGFIRLEKSPDGLLHFNWIDKTSNQEDNSITKLLFAGDGTTLKKVKTGKPTDRVYMLHIQATFENSTPVMFWMQDKDASTDSTNISNFNSHLAGVTPAAPVQTGGIDFSSLLQTYSATPATPAPPASSSSSSSSSSSAAIPPTPPSNASSTDALAANLQRLVRRQIAPASIEEVITAEGIINSGILSDPAIRAQLIPLLPEGQREDRFIEENIRSPQFRQSLEALGHALQTDNYNSVLANFGLNPQAGADHLMAGDSTSAFLASVQSQADQQSSAMNVDSSSSSSSNSSSNSSSGATSSEEGYLIDPSDFGATHFVVTDANHRIKVGNLITCEGNITVVESVNGRRIVTESAHNFPQGGRVTIMEDPNESMEH